MGASPKSPKPPIQTINLREAEFWSRFVFWFATVVAFGNLKTHVIPRNKICNAHEITEARRSYHAMCVCVFGKFLMVSQGWLKGKATGSLVPIGGSPLVLICAHFVRVPVAHVTLARQRVPDP